MYNQLMTIYYSDDAGFNDCVVACYTLSNKCRDLLINIREDVCRCNVDKRKELLTVGQRHVNQTSQFGLKANQVAQIILYGEEPKYPQIKIVK